MDLMRYDDDDVLSRRHKGSLRNGLSLSLWSRHGRDGVAIMRYEGPIPEDLRPPVRTTPSLAAGKLISEKSPAQRSIEKPNAKIAKVREKKEKLARAKVQMKRAGEGSSMAPRKKRARKVNETARSDYGETVYVTPIHQANLKPLNETTTSHPKDTIGNATIELRPTNAKQEVFFG
ncbi:hypothetical protein Tco_0595532 [Tanacetum coccineum]